MKVIIAGGRFFNDYELLKTRCDYYLGCQAEIEVVSGCQRGADKLGERWASERKLEITRCPADWNKYGTAAGPIRNRVMAEYADALIAFWDGKSDGTKNMIEEAEKRNLKIKIVNY